MNPLCTASTLLGLALLALAPAPATAQPKAPHRPAAEAFGFGPRVSEKKLYKATLQPAAPLKLRDLLTIPILVTDAEGKPVEGVRISIDGGMPEHGHGLPTRPRMGRALGQGVYELEGLRFSMDGWWELILTIDGPKGSDRVTFNLGL